MQRFGMAARVSPDGRGDYLRMHREVWPQVEATVTACGIRNFSIFVIDDVLFGYYEYVGSDYEADQRRMAADPVTQEWWVLTGRCQLPFRPGSDAPSWEPLTEAWHLD